MLISLTMGVLYALGFMILRVPLGLTVGLIAGLLNFVPYLGTLTGLLLSLLFVILDGAGLGRTLGGLGVFAAVQAFEGYFLTPKFQGTSLNLHPMWVLVGLMIGGNLFGLLGIILAVPVIAAGKVIFSFFAPAYQQTDFYRSSGSELLTGEGAPVELITSAGMGSLSSPDSPETAPRQPRIIVTTGELRSRRPTPPSSDDS
jgi:predicted PurR-regulated permease PerM